MRSHNLKAIALKFLKLHVVTLGIEAWTLVGPNTVASFVPSESQEWEIPES